MRRPARLRRLALDRLEGRALARQKLLEAEAKQLDAALDQVERWALRQIREVAEWSDEDRAEHAERTAAGAGMLRFVLLSRGFTGPGEATYQAFRALLIRARLRGDAAAEAEVNRLRPWTEAMAAAPGWQPGGWDAFLAFRAAFEASPAGEGP